MRKKETQSELVLSDVNGEIEFRFTKRGGGFDLEISRELSEMEIGPNSTKKLLDFIEGIVRSKKRSK